MERLDDRYDVLDTVAGRGRVHLLKAWDRDRRQTVAVKLFALDHRDDADRLRSEVELLMAVPPHPHLAVVHEELSLRNAYAVVFGWVDGPDLATVLRQRGTPGLDPATVLGYAEQAARALDHLHGQRPPVVHGDVKPANLVLSADDRLVLVDFGSAVQSGDPGRSGTRGFAAPELALGAPMTAATDVYALAATVSALLAGRVPQGLPEPSPAGSTPGWRHLWSLLGAAMSPEPARRPTSGGALVEGLRSVLEPSGTAVPSRAVLAVEATEPGDPWGVRSPSRAAVAAEVARLLAELADGDVEPAGRAGATGPAAASFDDASAAVAADRQLRAELRRRLQRAGLPDVDVYSAVAAGLPDEATTTRSVARALLDTAPAGQVVLSQAAAAALAATPGAPRATVSLGVVHLPALQRPDRVVVLVGDVDATVGATRPLDTRPVARGGRGRPVVSVQREPLVGREQDVANVVGLLTTSHVVTVAGAPGVGKSRLAAECAGLAAGGFPDGVWRLALPLAPVATEEVARGLLAVLGGDGAGSGTLVSGPRPAPPAPLARLVRRLRRRAALVVLDDCDLARAGCQDVVAAVRDGCPDVRFLVTSRRALGRPDETTYRLGPLPLAESVAWFATVVSRGSGATVPATDADAVMEICRRLDGVPQAIEVAAGRYPTLSVRAIAASLDGAVPTAPPSSASTQTALEWSIASLPEAERRVLRRLSVFAASVPPEAAVDICRASGAGSDEDTLRALAALVSHSLLETDDGDGGYRMLGTVREVARRQLLATDERGQTRHSHAAWYAAFAARIETGAWGGQQVESLDAAVAQLPNLRAAFDSSIADRDADAAASLASRLGMVWLVRGRLDEGRRWLGEALALGPSQPTPTAWAWCTAALLAVFAGDPAAATRASLRALESAQSAGDGRVVARAESVLGLVAAGTGLLAESRARHEAAVAAGRDADDDWAVAFALANLGNPLVLQGELRTARERYTESLELRRSAGDLYGVSWSAYRLGSLVDAMGEPRAARELLLEAWDAATRLGFDQGCVHAAIGLGRHLLTTRHPLAASGWLAEALARSDVRQDAASRTLALAGLVECAAARQDTTEVARRSAELAGSTPQAALETTVASALAEAAVAEHGSGSVATARAVRSTLVALRWSRDRPRMVQQVERLAMLVAAEDPARAAFLATAARTHRERMGLAVPVAVVDDVDALDAWVRTSDDPLVRDAARAATGCSVELAVDVALGVSWPDHRVTSTSPVGS